MGEQPSDRYPRSWEITGTPPRGVRWAAAHPVGFALVMVAVVAGLVAAALWWWLSPLVSVTVGVTVGLAVGAGSLVAQKDLRALLARWDEEHGGP
jgi:hypothetical protein